MTSPARLSSPGTRRRWYVCGLLFFATTINYIDRQVLGLLKPVLEGDLHWKEAEYGWVVFSFQLAYAAVMPLAGRALDWIGTRLGYLIAVTVWSLAAMAHALAGSAVQFSIARFALGVGESANFPAAIKTVSDWFPAEERALATGIFNSGSNVGAIVAPLAVPWIAAAWGWRAAFLFTGAIGFMWVALWFATYRDPVRAAEAVRAAHFSYLRLIGKRQTWAFLLGKFLTDPIWWFYLFWLPGFLYKNYGLNLLQLGPPLVAVYLAADVGSIGGGWISSALIRRGWTANRARKTAMLACALCISGVAFVPLAHASLWLTVALISLATAGHQGWSANLYTLSSDLFPRPQIGSVVGLGGFGGAVGGMLVAPAVGYWLDWTGGWYSPLFVIAGTIYVVALIVVHALAPTWELVE